MLRSDHTAWDAPGMVRIKIPFGGLTPEKMDVMAELADEYADYILHVSTRQDIQLHFVHIEDTPELQMQAASNLISPTLTEKLVQHHQDERIVWRARPYRDGDVVGARSIVNSTTPPKRSIEQSLSLKRSIRLLTQ